MPFTSLKTTQLAWLLATPICTSAQVSYFERDSGSAGDVLVLGPVESRPTELQGITLLTIDCAGRTRLAELLEGRARRREDIPDAARLVLPREQGSLYKYRRDSSPGAIFGYFVVGNDGVARSVFEFPGAGPSGLDDPFLGKVAVASDGRAILTATTVAAGGDLWEIDLSTGAEINRTSALVPLAIKDSGLVLLSGWGFAPSVVGAMRFDRDVGAPTSLVGMPGTYAWFGPDAVYSEDESSVAFLAGDSDAAAYVLVCRQTGRAVQASNQAMAIPGAGFLPQVGTGPWLALSADGSKVAWRAAGYSSECFLTDVSPASAPDDLHITSSERFYYTLNETGVIAFVGRESLVLMVGRRDGTDITRADFFRVEQQPGGALVASNLTGTSGVTKAPFDYGYLSSTDSLHRIPGAAPAAFLLHQCWAGFGNLMWLEEGKAPVVFLDRVQSLDWVEIAGTHLVASVHRSPGVDYPFEASINLLQVPKGGLGTTTIVMPPGCRLTSQTASRSRGLFAGVFELEVGEWLGRIQVPSTTGLTLTTSLIDYGPTTGFTSDGSVAASVGLPGAQLALSWSDQGVQFLRRSPGQGFVLPGS